MTYEELKQARDKARVAAVGAEVMWQRSNWSVPLDDAAEEALNYYKRLDMTLINLEVDMLLERV